jgi:hypothetical protein
MCWYTNGGTIAVFSMILSLSAELFTHYKMLTYYIVHWCNTTRKWILCYADINNLDLQCDKNIWPFTKNFGENMEETCNL